MATRKLSSNSNEEPLPPATTVPARENQLIKLAYDLAEKQLRDGSASSQVMTQFLKMGTVREQKEREKIALENKLLEARTANLGNADRMEDLMTKAIEAFSGYKPTDDDD